MVQGGLGGDADEDDGPSDDEQQAAMAQALELHGSMEEANPSENSERRIVKPREHYARRPFDEGNIERDEKGQFAEQASRKAEAAGDEADWASDDAAEKPTAARHATAGEKHHKARKL